MKELLLCLIFFGLGWASSALFSYYEKQAEKEAENDKVNIV